MIVVLLPSKIIFIQILFEEKPKKKRTQIKSQKNWNRSGEWSLLFQAFSIRNSNNDHRRGTRHQSGRNGRGAMRARRAASNGDGLYDGNRGDNNAKCSIP